jgi:hypothetical protein
MLSAFALIFGVPVIALNLLYTAVPVLVSHCCTGARFALL